MRDKVGDFCLERELSALRTTANSPVRAVGRTRLSGSGLPVAFRLHVSDGKHFVLAHSLQIGLRHVDVTSFFQRNANPRAPEVDMSHGPPKWQVLNFEPASPSSRTRVTWGRIGIAAVEYIQGAPRHLRGFNSARRIDQSSPHATPSTRIRGFGAARSGRSRS